MGVQTAVLPVEIHAIVDGKRLPARETFKRENPANPDEVVGIIASNTREDAQQAIDAAERAFPDWSNAPIDERAERLRRMDVEGFMEYLELQTINYPRTGKLPAIPI